MRQCSPMPHAFVCLHATLAFFVLGHGSGVYCQKEQLGVNDSKSRNERMVVTIRRTVHLMDWSDLLCSHVC
jgi:hypothetical protein